MNAVKVVLQVIFCHPPGAQWSDGFTAQPIRWLRVCFQLSLLFLFTLHPIVVCSFAVNSQFTSLTEKEFGNLKNPVILRDCTSTDINLCTANSKHLHRCLPLYFILSLNAHFIDSIAIDRIDTIHWRERGMSWCFLSIYIGLGSSDSEQITKNYFSPLSNFILVKKWNPNFVMLKWVLGHLYKYNLLKRLFQLGLWVLNTRIRLFLGNIPLWVQFKSTYTGKLIIAKVSTLLVLTWIIPSVLTMIVTENQEMIKRNILVTQL